MSNNENQLAVLPPTALARQVDAPTWNALFEIYDSPSPEKLGIVIDYCKARKLDPLKKPVHIVSVWSKKAGKMVETIWPAISELRITAMRTGNFASMEECKFGPIQKQKLGNMELEFPEWAQITINRIVRVGDDTKVLPFPGPRVYFVESYASVKGAQDLTPNSMWAKRTWGQLEKCAEAAALRRAFPEECGNDHTAEEMAGRIVHDVGGLPLAEAAPQGSQPAGGEQTGDGGSASGTQAEGTAPAVVRRARTPRKGASAAAAPTEPQTPAPASQIPPGGNGVIVDGEVTEVKEESAPAAPAEDKTPAPAPKPEPAAVPGRKPKYQQPDGWPLVIEATVEDVVSGRDMLIEDIATGEKKIMKINLVTLGGSDIAKHGLPAKVVFDPTNADLNAKAKKGEAVIKLTLESWPSQSRVGTQILVAVEGTDVELI